MSEAKKSGDRRLGSRDYSLLRRRKYRRLQHLLLWTALAALLCMAGAAWLGTKATAIGSELSSASELVPDLRTAILADDKNSAHATVFKMGEHTRAAKEAGDDPLWLAAAALPWIGQNFRAASEVATTADDVVRLGARPLVDVFQSLDWSSLAPSQNGVDLSALSNAEPKISGAAQAVSQSADRLDDIDAQRLLPEIAEPLVRAKTELGSLRSALRAAADTAALAPNMMGDTEPRNYLLIIQNNAESRASGGIPGALAVLNVDKGALTLVRQSSAGEIGVISPPVNTAIQQREIYSQRIEKFMQDVNLTPDFPTAATTAAAMWDRRYGEKVDGVISLDPVALSYLLDAIGPVELTRPELIAFASTGLPTSLTAENVVKTLLSDVYAQVEKPAVQDVYFAGVAQEIFAALSDGDANAKDLIKGISRGSAEGRVLLWSARRTEQSIVARYPISGSIDGPSVSPAQFGVYFNDGTGAKMDYYVKRTVQLVKHCPVNGYEQTTVRVMSTNTAPQDASTSLPSYVTGGGAYGVPSGFVQTNIAAYGPAQANVETVDVGGQLTPFAPHLHGDRPVAVMALRLAPGETQTVEFTFGKIVQHSEPDLFVTPTVQPVGDVILPTETVYCG